MSPILATLFLSFIEGVTEFLPISSTAHLIVTQHIFNLNLPKELLALFVTLLQGGAALGIFALVWDKIWKKNNVRYIIVAMIPTVVIGYFLHPIFQNYLAGSITIIAITLIVGGILFLYKPKPSLETRSLTYKEAFLFGLFQSIAIIPGVSRSGATLLGGNFRNVKLSETLNFTFMLSVPTLLLASLYDLSRTPIIFLQEHQTPILIGVVASAIIAYVVGKFALSYISHYGIRIFGWYRIGLGILLLVLLSFGIR